MAPTSMGHNVRIVQIVVINALMLLSVRCAKRVTSPIQPQEHACHHFPIVSSLLAQLSVTFVLQDITKESWIASANLVILQIAGRVSLKSSLLMVANVWTVFQDITFRKMIKLAKNVNLLVSNATKPIV